MKATDIIEETVAYYSQDPKGRRAVTSGLASRCVYRTDDDRMCAVGRKLIESKNVGLRGGVSTLYSQLDGVCKTMCIETLLKEQYRGFPIEFWRNLQVMHDTGDYWTDEGLSEMGEVYKQNMLNAYKDVTNESN